MGKKIVGDFLYEKESYEIRGAAFEIWRTFKGIFKEKIVERSLQKELESRGFNTESQKKLNIYYRGEKIGIYMPDIVVDNKILIEIKVKPFLTKEDERQFWYYLRGSDYKLGFLINFGSEKLEIKRRIYDKARDKYQDIGVNQRTHQRVSASKNAFSLLELLIIIAITAILFGAGFIKLVNYRQRQTLDLTKQSIVAALRDAQNRSISQESGSRWGVHFSNPAGNANDSFELFSGASYNLNNVVSKINLDPEIKFSDPADGSFKDIIFSPITGKSTTAASIVIVLVSDASVFSTITVDENGKIQY